MFASPSQSTAHSFPMPPFQFQHPPPPFLPQGHHYLSGPGILHQQQPPLKENIETNICKICKATLNTHVINCHSCDSLFHRSCTGVSEDFYQHFIVAEDCPWYCHFCEMKVLQTSETLSTNIDTARDEIQNVIEEQFNTLSAMISTTKQEMNIKLTKLENTVMTEIQSMKESISEVVHDNNSDERINFLEAELKKKNLILNGIPQMNNENLHDIIIKIGQICGIPINPSDIETAFRVKSKTFSHEDNVPTLPDPAILVKFFAENVKSNLFSGYLKLINRQQFLKCNNLGLPTNNRIYMNHHLSPGLRKLYDRALLLKKAAVFQAVTTKSHVIAVKVNEKWIDIASEQQLNRLIATDFVENVNNFE